MIKIEQEKGRKREGRRKKGEGTTTGKEGGKGSEYWGGMSSRNKWRNLNKLTELIMLSWQQNCKICKRKLTKAGRGKVC